MPQEKPIEVGDSEESPVDVDISQEDASLEASKETEEAPREENEEELEEYSAGVKSRIDKLTKRFREEERQKQTAVEFAENVKQENDALKGRLESLDKGYQEQFDNRVKSQLDSAKRLLKEAHENGDIDKIVEAQEALAALSVEKGRLASPQKRTAEAQASQQAPPTPSPQPQQPPAKADPKAEAWAAQHDWFGQDEVMTYAAFWVHRRLIEDEGFDPQSDEYMLNLTKE